MRVALVLAVLLIGSLLSPMAAAQAPSPPVPALSPTDGILSKTAPDGDLSGSLNASTVPAGVEAVVGLSGAAGNGSAIRIYVVDPRGRVFGTATRSHAGSQVSLSDEEYEVELEVFDHTGDYVVLVIGQGPDGTFDHDRETGTTDAATQQLTVERIRTAYSGSDVDDPVLQLEVTGVAPTLAIDPFTTDRKVERGTVTVSGETNLPDGTTLFVTVRDRFRETVVDEEVNVSDDGSWEAELDFSGVEVGAYDLLVRARDAGRTLDFYVVSDIDDPIPDGSTVETTRAPAGTPTPIEVTRVFMRQSDRTVVHTRVVTRTKTSGGLDGFGFLVGAVALVGGTWLARRRNEGR